MNQALCFVQAMNRPQEAISAYLQAIRLRPDFAIAHGNLASLYYEQGQLEQAIATYRDAILLEPTFVEAYNNLVSKPFMLPARSEIMLLSKGHRIKGQLAASYASIRLEATFRDAD